MPKYLITWETDIRQIPSNEREQWTLYLQMLEMTKKALQDDPSADWGQFVGCNKGYAISDKNLTELFQSLQKFTPHLTFEIQEVLSVDQCIYAIQTLMKPGKGSP